MCSPEKEHFEPSSRVADTAAHAGRTREGHRRRGRGGGRADGRTAARGLADLKRQGAACRRRAPVRRRAAAAEAAPPPAKLARSGDEPGPSPPKLGGGPADAGAAERGLAAELGDSTIRVNVTVLDRLMNLIGELVLGAKPDRSTGQGLRDSNVNGQAACQRLNPVTSDLQEQVMKTRMQPIGASSRRFPGWCATSSPEHPQAGEHTDRGHLHRRSTRRWWKAIRDPVMHIIRNAIDHGSRRRRRGVRRARAAAGKPRLRAAHEGGMVTIEVEDDGRGMDPEALRNHAVKKDTLWAADAERLSDREALDLVFRADSGPRRKSPTSPGGAWAWTWCVRMWSVRAARRRLDSMVGKGTTVRLKMPLTLAIIPALLVSPGSSDLRSRRSTCSSSSTSMRS